MELKDWVSDFPKKHGSSDQATYWTFELVCLAKRKEFRHRCQPVIVTWKSLWPNLSEYVFVSWEILPN